MSKVGKIEKMIFENFNDGGEYTVDDFKRKAVELQLIESDDKYTIKNTLYKIKNYPSVKSLGKGRYKIGKQKEEAENDITVESAFDFLNDRLEKIKQMNVIENSFEELQQSKKEIEFYNKYIRKFSKILEK